MKRFLLVGAALLALATVAPANAASPGWSWDGWYLGGNAGYSWGRSKTTTTFIANTTQTFNSSVNMNGWLAGLQAGFNKQNGNWVWGIEADIQATGQKGTSAFTCGAGLCTNTTAVPGPLAIVTGNLEQKLDWFGTLRGRIGPTLTPTIWAYFTVGLAVGHIKSAGTINTFTALVPISAAVSDSTTKFGWTIGAGVEGRISGNWTAKFEYLFVDLGAVGFATTIPTAAPATTVNVSSKITDHILRVGLNYNFR